MLIKFKLITLFLIFMIISSCSKYESIEDSINEPAQHENECGERLLGEINRFLSEMGQSTRANRDIERIDAICVENTRSAVSDTLLYLLNFTDDQGFAISNAMNPEEIYAISSEGRLTITDIRNHEELQILMYQYIINAINLKESRENTSRSEEGWVYKVVLNVTPKLNRHVSKWHQSSPFNGYTKDNRPVGCRTLSLGQVMSYYEWPQGRFYPGVGDITKNYNFNWSLINGDNNSISTGTAAKMLAFLVDDILHGKPSTNNNGDIVGTNVDLPDLLQAIPKLGFYEQRVFYNEPLQDNMTALVDFLENGSKINDIIYPPAPVMIWGMGNPASETTYRGHQWVIDAVVQRGKVYIFENNHEVPFGTRETFFRCVWGWKGNSCIGYYRYLDVQNMGDPQQYIPLAESTTLIGEKGSIRLSEAYNDWLIIGGLIPDTIP